jgi:hypothetical protein
MTTRRRNSTPSGGTPRRTGLIRATSAPPLDGLDPLRHRCRETSLTLDPTPQFQPLLIGLEPLRPVRQSIVVKLLSSQDAAILVTPRQPHRTLIKAWRPQQPAQRTSHTITNSETDGRQRRHILRPPGDTDILPRRSRPPITHNQCRPQLRAGKPRRNRRIRPTRHRRRTTTQDPRHRSTSGLNPDRIRGRLPRRTRHPQRVINHRRRRHHPPRQNTRPRHEVKYEHQHRQTPRGQHPQPSGPSARSLRRPGRRPEPRHHFGKQGDHQAGCFLTARTSPARRRATPRKGNPALALRTHRPTAPKGRREETTTRTSPLQGTTHNPVPATYPTRRLGDHQWPRHHPQPSRSTPQYQSMLRPA